MLLYIRQGCVLMGTLAPQGLATLRPTLVSLEHTGTTHLVTAERHVFYVHPVITARAWELTCPYSALRWEFLEIIKIVLMIGKTFL